VDAPDAADVRSFEVRLRAVRPVADRVVSLEFQSTNGDPLPSWTSGAHVDLVLPSGLVRQYSLCGDPADLNTYRVAVLREANGRGGSAEVHDSLQVGQLLELRGPRNHFPLRPAARYLFIAGGIGITPLLAHARAAHERSDAWSLIYGARNESCMAFVDELIGFSSGKIGLFPQDTYGLLDLDRIVAELDDDTDVYCCGPTPLLDAVAEKVPSSRLHVEHFASTHRESAISGSFEVEFAQSGMTVAVGPDRNILDTALEAGLQPLWSCREGLCGTCITRVLSGEPEHLDDLLDDDERAANDQMLICVSRSKSPRLVLDM
jgi:ferredoxin-NADP reductase